MFSAGLAPSRGKYRHDNDSPTGSNNINALIQTLNKTKNKIRLIIEFAFYVPRAKEIFLMTAVTNHRNGPPLAFISQIWSLVSCD